MCWVEKSVHRGRHVRKCHVLSPLVLSVEFLQVGVLLPGVDGTSPEADYAKLRSERFLKQGIVQRF